MNFTDTPRYSWFFTNLDTLRVTEVKARGDINDALAGYQKVCEDGDIESHDAVVFWTHQTYGAYGTPDYSNWSSKVRVERVQRPTHTVQVVR